MAPRKKADDKPATSAAGKRKVNATAAAAEDGGGGDGSGGDPAGLIMGYLRRVNRPYSAIEISANLHNKVTKAATTKILKDLHERNQVEGRTAGKQIVYHVPQNPDDALTPEQITTIDSTISNLQATTANLQATAKTLRSTLSALNSTLSTADLITNVQALDAEKQEMSGRLETLRAGKAKKVTKKERDEVEKGWKAAGLAKRRREKIASEMWKLIEDLLESSEQRDELREQLGLDE
ncbi:TBPIP-domain-containing protein [Periconia macrospinosa]|uniref:TBPIP-domain-containing protein n=1 Tax=Periconia macrospinosa TaxID=97972 RepID=A0A2V1E8U7_9PLEO|nr:TBPIP-domain-containing protein [Periconia macrospinosa]